MMTEAQKIAALELALNEIEAAAARLEQLGEVMQAGRLDYVARKIEWIMEDLLQAVMN